MVQKRTVWMVWMYNILLKHNTRKELLSTVNVKKKLLFLFMFPLKRGLKKPNRTNSTWQFLGLLFYNVFIRSLKKQSNQTNKNKSPQDVLGTVCFRHKISSPVSDYKVGVQWPHYKEWIVSAWLEQYELLTSVINNWPKTTPAQTSVIIIRLVSGWLDSRVSCTNPKRLLFGGWEGNLMRLLICIH